jgi:hypothetical protein
MNLMRVCRGLIVMGVCLSAAGCGGGCGSGSPPVLPGGAHSIRLVIIQGPSTGTMALVPVTIEGQGPFNFALDTGASHSAIDRELAERLNLPVTGKPTKVAGVGAISEAVPVKVSEWRAGDVELPAGTLVTLEMPSTSRDLKLQGLLGSDVLSRYGAVKVDYVGKELTLHPK